jgi:hypothetical protein
VWIHLLALELIDGAGPVAAVVTTTTTPGGVRRARFLRRAPKLPWEHDEEPEEQITVAPPKRKRIPMPAVRAMREATGGAIPIQTIKEIPAPVIHVPEFGAVTLDIEDDDDWLWLI